MHLKTNLEQTGSNGAEKELSFDKVNLGCQNNGLI